MGEKYVSQILISQRNNITFAFIYFEMKHTNIGTSIANANEPISSLSLSLSLSLSPINCSIHILPIALCAFPSHPHPTHPSIVFTTLSISLRSTIN